MFEAVIASVLSLGAVAVLAVRAIERSEQRDRAAHFALYKTLTQSSAGSRRQSQAA